MESAARNLAGASLPSELNTAAQGHGLEVHRDKLTVHYKAEGRHSADVGAIQANRPIPSKLCIYYYELTVIEKGEAGRIAIGFSDKSFKLTKQPGWEPGSYGYHGDDGKKFGGNGKGEDYGPKFAEGDTVGAAYNLANQEIFFTKNGNKLRTAFRNVKGELFPTIGLHSKGEVVKVNFGQAPFKFDIEALICEERAAQAAAIDRVPVSTHLVHQVVRQYLLHYGYRDTLEALDQEAGSEQLDGDDGPCSMAIDSGPSEPLPSPATSNGTNGTASAAASTSSAALVWEGDWARDGALPVRQFVRRAIMQGDMKGAVDCIRKAYPQILEGGPGFEMVRFHLATQQYIELVRSGAIDAAVTFAQTTLAPLHRSSSSFSSHGSASAVAGSSSSSSSLSAVATGPSDVPSEAALRDVVALVAYEHPETSPLAWLLGPEQRERVADAANAALLAQASGDSPGTIRRSGVERLLGQLVAVQATMFELNGNQGEPFSLSDHLPARRQKQPAQLPTAMQCSY